MHINTNSNSLTLKVLCSFFAAIPRIGNSFSRLSNGEITQLRYGSSTPPLNMVEKNLLRSGQPDLPLTTMEQQQMPCSMSNYTVFRGKPNGLPIKVSKRSGSQCRKQGKKHHLLYQQQNERNSLIRIKQRRTDVSGVVKKVWCARESSFSGSSNSLSSLHGARVNIVHPRWM